LSTFNSHLAAVGSLPEKGVFIKWSVEANQVVINMNQEKGDASELFYSFFSSIKPRQPKGTSTQDEWQLHVFPHGAIEELSPNLWHVTGTLPSSTMVPREMVIYRLADATLLIHSAIALNEPEWQNLSL
jgi:hypothetical protein